MKYSDENRGKIQFVDRKLQKLDYSEIRALGANPIQVSGEIEYHDKAYITYLSYHKWEPSQTEQEVLKSQTDILMKAGKPSLLIFSEVEDNGRNPVELGEQPVDGLYINNTYSSVGKTQSVEDISRKFISLVDSKGICADGEILPIDWESIPAEEPAEPPLLNFSKLRFGKITPTDIDGVLNYEGKVIIQYEFKKDAGGGEFTAVGQNIAAKRKIDDINSVGVPAYYIMATHFVNDTAQDVNAGECAVRHVYRNDEFCREMNGLDVTEVTKRIIEKHS